LFFFFFGQLEVKGQHSKWLMHIEVLSIQGKS